MGTKLKSDSRAHLYFKHAKKTKIKTKTENDKQWTATVHNLKTSRITGRLCAWHRRASRSESRHAKLFCACRKSSLFTPPSASAAWTTPPSAADTARSFGADSRNIRRRGTAMSFSRVSITAAAPMSSLPQTLTYRSCRRCSKVARSRLRETVVSSASSASNTANELPACFSKLHKTSTWGATLFPPMSSCSSSDEMLAVDSHTKSVRRRPQLESRSIERGREILPRMRETHSRIRIPLRLRRWSCGSDARALASTLTSGRPISPDVSTIPLAARSNAVRLTNGVRAGQSTCRPSFVMPLNCRLIPVINCTHTNTVITTK